MDILEVLEDMVSTGQPPTEGCSLLGVGYEEAFSLLEQTYIDGRFSRGKSAEKFIIGPYGAGKTHFLRQLLEIAQRRGCATAEVVLSGDIDITKPLVVYKEVAREMRVPGQESKGMEGLLQQCYAKIRSEESNPELVDEYVRCRIDGLKDVSFENVSYQRVLINTLTARFTGDEEQFHLGCRWLDGEVTLGSLAKTLGESPITSTEQNLFGRRAIFCLCQFVKAMGYPGTVVGFDEAEQAANVTKRQLQKILSMLRSEIDAVSTAKNASLLVVYAVLPNVVQEMQNYPALQQRISEPNPERKFFDGEVYSPRIDLGHPYSDAGHSALNILERIGGRLVDLLYEQYGSELLVSKEGTLSACFSWAEEVFAKNASLSNRRDMVKLTASRLLHLKSTSILDSSITPPEPPCFGDEEV